MTNTDLIISDLMIINKKRSEGIVDNALINELAPKLVQLEAEFITEEKALGIYGDKFNDEPLTEEQWINELSSGSIRHIINYIDNVDINIIDAKREKLLSPFSVAC